MMHSHPRSGNAAWLRNRILGGNARDERSYAQLVRGEPADMAFLDPLFAAAVGRKSSCKAVSRCGSAGHGHVPVAWNTAFAIAASGAGCRPFTCWCLPLDGVAMALYCSARYDFRLRRCGGQGSRQNEQGRRTHASRSSRHASSMTRSSPPRSRRGATSCSGRGPPSISTSSARWFSGIRQGRPRRRFQQARRRRPRREGGAGFRREGDRDRGDADRRRLAAPRHASEEANHGELIRSDSKASR
jgi:hypothetical protein